MTGSSGQLVLEAGSGTARHDTHAVPDLLPVRVVTKEPVSQGVVRLVVRRSDGHPFPAWTPGAHIDVLVGDLRTRQYSLTGHPGNRDEYVFAVLREPAGSGTSAFLHDSLAVGDTFLIDGPRNHFTLNNSPSYLFIAGGIGITPIVPMIAAAKAAGREWTLAYGGRSRGSMAFVSELQRYGDRVTVHPHDEVGLLDLETLLGTPLLDTLVYCCGPEPLLKAVEERCHSWPPGALHMERFSAKPVTAGAGRLLRGRAVRDRGEADRLT